MKDRSCQRMVQWLAWTVVITVFWGGTETAKGQVRVPSANAVCWSCEARIGAYSVESMGLRTVRLTVTGRSGQRYKLGIDAVVLAEAPLETLERPTGLETSQVAPNGHT